MAPPIDLEEARRRRHSTAVSGPISEVDDAHNSMDQKDRNDAWRRTAILATIAAVVGWILVFAGWLAVIGLMPWLP